jgi:hypothetical protein
MNETTVILTRGQAIKVAIAYECLTEATKDHNISCSCTLCSARRRTYMHVPSDITIDEVILNQPPETP